MHRSQFEITPIPEPWSKMVIVTGLPGNRSDFIHGWLTSPNQDQFIPSDEWLIDPFWGKNHVSWNWNWWMLDQPGWPNLQVRENQHNIACINRFKDMLRSICRDQWSSGTRWAMSKSHYTSASLLRILPDELHQHFIILDLLVSDYESLDIVRWEMWVKNVLSRIASSNPKHHQNAIEYIKKVVDIPPDCTDVMTQLELSYAGLCRWPDSQDSVFNHCQNTSCQNAQVKSIGYRDLMTSKGWQLLEDALGTTLNHDIWDQSLALTASRSRYYVLGRWWERPA